MSRIVNTHKKVDEYTTLILVTKTDDINFLKEYLVDTKYLPLLGKIRAGKNNYAFSGTLNIANIIMELPSSRLFVVDHINNDIYDNRKTNLRVVSARQNATNRSKSKNNTGVVGIAERRNGNYHYFRATVTDNSLPIEGVVNGACKRHFKNFNIGKLGKDIAFKEAKKWLEEKRKEFNYL